ILNKIMKKNIRPLHLAIRPGDVFKTQAAIAKAKKYLRFKPLIDFPEGLTRVVEWFKQAEVI
ncbi:hypothetical protein ACFL1D_05125, partial [Candidatus Omnitrophota bacterium]